MFYYFVLITFLFLLGATVGYLIEVVFRRFVSAKRWINPGFLNGPYLPLYGFGLLVLYILASIDLSGVIGNVVLRNIVLILLMTFGATLLEYLVGLYCVKVLHVTLWDYSDRKFNIQGIICPLFTVFWGIIAAAYYFLLHPYIEGAVRWLADNMIYSFVVGFVFGIFTIDVIYSLKVVNKLKKFAKDNNIVLTYYKVKLSIKKHMEESQEKYSFLFPFKTKELKEQLNKYLEEAKNKVNEKMNEKIGKKNKKQD